MDLFGGGSNNEEGASKTMPPKSTWASACRPAAGDDLALLTGPSREQRGCASKASEENAGEEPSAKRAKVDPAPVSSPAAVPATRAFQQPCEFPGTVGQLICAASKTTAMEGSPLSSEERGVASRHVLIYSGQPPRAVLPTAVYNVRALEQAATATLASAPGQALAPAGVTLETACSEDKGQRREMEDAWVITPDAREDHKSMCRCSYAAIFDGHGGRKAADLAAAKLHTSVLAAGLLSNQTGEPTSAASIGVTKRAIIEGFKRTDQAILTESAAQNWQDGSTAVCMWACGECIHIANVGDAKAVLARGTTSHGGSGGETLRAIVLTKEHKAIYAPERARIEKAGGVVTDGRLQGRIEVSRSFGDRAFKKVGMSAVPELRSFQLGQTDRFLLMGCDGFWGVFGPQDAVEFVSKYMDGRSVKAVCNRILNEAIRVRKCKDNCTVMLTVFTHHSAC